MKFIKSMIAITACAIIAVGNPLFAQSPSFVNPDSIFTKLVNITNKESTKNELQLLSFKQKFTISSKEKYKTVLDSLFDEKYFYYPIQNNDVTELDVLTKGQMLYSFPKRYKEFKKATLSYLKKELSIGDKVYVLSWKLDSENFCTLAFASSDHVIYEFILTNVIRFNQHSNTQKNLRSVDLN